MNTQTPRNKWLRRGFLAGLVMGVLLAIVTVFVVPILIIAYSG